MIMTREEAIDVIQRLSHTEAKWPGTEDTLEALDMAIDALRPASREQVEKLRGEWISLEPEIGLFECSMCDHMILQVKCNFCPSCGAPMTDEAVQMVINRMEALKNGE